MRNKDKQLIIVCPEPYDKGGISMAVGGLIDGFKQQGVNVITVESRSSILSKWQAWVKAVKQVKQLSKQYGRDAVFVFHCGSWFSMLRKWSLAIIANFYHSTTVVHLHSVVVENYLSRSGSKCLFRLFLASFNQIITVSPWWKSLLEKKLQILNVDSIYNSVTNDAIDIANIQNDADCKILSEKADIKLLSMSRLVDGKGFEALIEAMSILPERYKLIIAGEGPLKSKLIAQVQQLNLENRVQFVGWVESAAKYKLMLDSDIFVLVARAESFGMGLIEAMACRVPVIALDRGPIRDVVSPDTGMLLKEDTAESQASGIEILASRHANFKGGPNRVLTVFHPEKIVSQAKSILLSVSK